MTCLTPLSIYIYFIDVDIGWSKDADLIHVVSEMLPRVLARTFDLVTVWHSTSLSSLFVGTGGKTILWLKWFNLL